MAAVRDARRSLVTSRPCPASSAIRSKTSGNSTPALEGMRAKYEPFLRGEGDSDACEGGYVGSDLYAPWSRQHPASLPDWRTQPSWLQPSSASRPLCYERRCPGNGGVDSTTPRRSTRRSSALSAPAAPPLLAPDPVPMFLSADYLWLLSWLECVDGPKDQSSSDADSSARTDEFCGLRRSLLRPIENRPPMTELRSETFDVTTATFGRTDESPLRDPRCRG